MLAGEGRHNEAITLLERRLAESPRNPDLLAALGRSNAALGDIPRAIEAFDAYLAVRPDDQAAREREAELLLQSGSIDRYLRMLAQVAASNPSPARVTRLAELYRLHGRVEDEINTLQTYAGRGFLEVSQLERLGALLAERGDWRSARRWLELADLIAPPNASAGRFLLLEVLILSGEVDQIEERAETWIEAWQSSFLSGKLILRIAQSGRQRTASRLALKCVDVAPDDALEIVAVLVSKGNQGLARQMLVRWANTATAADDAHLRTFVQEAAMVGEVEAALGKFLTLAHSGSNAATMGHLAEQLVSSFGSPALAAIRPYLSNDALLTRPLLAAELSLSDGNRELARWYLSRIEPSEIPPEKITTWLALEHQAELDADAFRRLTKLSIQGRLPKDLAPDLADEAAKLGHPAAHDLIWNSLRQ